MRCVFKITLLLDVLFESYASFQSTSDAKEQGSNTASFGGASNSIGGCRDQVDVMNSHAIVLELEAEIRILAQIQLNVSERFQARERSNGAMWRLSDFDRKVFLRQLADESQSASAEALHGRCFEIASNGSVFWGGCSANTSRCYLPHGYQPSEEDSPQPKLQSLESLEDSYTEVVLRSGLNTPPCCRFHIIEMLFALCALLQHYRATWQAADGTLLSALRVGEIFPWEYDADINIRDDSGGTALRSVLLEALSALGYNVEVAKKSYWIVRYSTSNTIYVDVFWETVRVFDSKFGTELKHVELHGVDFPYFENPSRTYGQGWMIPNRGPECVDRCSSVADDVARLRCTCTCAREEVAVTDARWNLKRWRLPEHFDGRASTLAKAIVQHVASREETIAGKACQMETSEMPDDPNMLRATLAANASQLMQFMELNSGRTVTCEDARDYCFGWFGSFVRGACPSTCGLHAALHSKEEAPSVISGVIFASAIALIVFIGATYI